MNPIQAIIFDSDGTLVDSESISLRVLVDLVAELGADIALAEAVAQWSGRDLHEVFSEIEQRLGDPLPGNFLEMFRTQQMARLACEVTAIPGAKDLLQSMVLPFCVASNAPQSKVRQCLKTTGLLPFVKLDHIFSAYDVDAWKPRPDLFLYAAEQMGIAPVNCAVVEDSAVGVEAGLAAGMQVFAYDPQGQFEDCEGVIRIRRLAELGRCW